MIARTRARLDRSPILARLLRGSLWSVFGTGAGRVLNLVAMVYAARTLGAEGFGQFGLVQTTLGLFALFAGAALGATATREIARLRQVEPERIGRVLGLVICVGGVSAAVFCGAIVVAAPWIGPLLVPGDGVTLALSLGALYVAALVFRGIGDGIIAGFERFDLVAATRCVEGAGAMIGIFAFVPILGVAGAILGLFAGSAAGLAVGLVFIRSLTRSRRVTPTFRGLRSEMPLIWRFSLPNLLASSAGMPAVWAAYVILSRTEGGVAEVGIYNAAYQWYAPAVFVPMAMAGVVLSIFSNLAGDGDMAELKRVYQKFGLAIFAVSVVTASLTFAAGWLLSGTYGPEFDGFVMVLAILLMTTPIHAHYVLQEQVLRGIDRSWSIWGSQVVWAGAILLGALTIARQEGAEGLACVFLGAFACALIVRSWFMFDRQRVPARIRAGNSNADG